MQISVRSHLLVGTAAVMTAGAVTVGGAVASPTGLPALRGVSNAEIQLAAVYNPLLDVFDTIQKANLYLFSIAEPPTTTFDRAGIFPDFLAAGFPIVTQYALNASDYVNQVGNYLFADFDPQADVYPGALRVLAWAGGALPENLGLALQQTLSGQFVQALQTLQFAIINPIQAAAYQVLNLGLYELGGVAARAAAVVTAIAEWVPTTIRALVDDVTVLGNAVALTIGNALGALQIGQPLAALDNLVHGLIGTNGNAGISRFYPTIPDALINQTIGEGGFIQTTPLYLPPEYVEAPSIRQNLTELRDGLADALATDVPVPEPPPFLVQGSFIDPLQSSIPTPWNPTPYIFTPAQSRAAAAQAAEAGKGPARAGKASVAAADSPPNRVRRSKP